MSPPLTKTRIGKPCPRHPELGGLRREVNYTCVGCDREKSQQQRLARMEAAGKTPRARLTPDQSAARASVREIARGRLRRQAPDYAAAQVERQRAWRKQNRERHRETCRAYDAKQMAENMQRRLSKNLRCRLRKAMLGETRGVSAVRDLGITIEEFRLYIAGLFKPGMSWDNYGAWHLDHRRPLAAFDLTDAVQAKAACHFSNLQPLWALENQRKWCKAEA